MKVRKSSRPGATKKGSRDTGKTASQSPRVPRKKITDEPRLPAQEIKFPVVGIGASAGGLEAFVELIRELPCDTGMAFVFAQHLDPRYKSTLGEILGRETGMPVCMVEHGMRIERNHAYIMPADMDLAVLHGVLLLMSRPESGTAHMPIDSFFSALADDQKEWAVGVVLSGMGSDGALGLKAIKAGGGVTFAQAGDSARFDSMPSSAIAASHVDYILSPREIARELVRLSRFPRLESCERDLSSGIIAASPDTLGRVLVLLRRSSGVDFTHYKQTTVLRRLSRRMLICKVDSLEHYARYLQQKPDELNALFQDMLINVTEFFREPEVFEALKKRVFPGIIQRRPMERPVRLWVPACSTGEEAYSLAIAFQEYLNEHDLHLPLQIFATDISDIAIDTARQGIYPENIAARLDADRLRRFFVKSDRGYQVSKSIRDLCLFARQDLTSDPPFSHLDLVSCRNLLIYLDPILQRKVLQMLHYALEPEAVLVLGLSETVGDFSGQFSVIDSKNRIFEKRQGVTPLPVEFRYSSGNAASSVGESGVAPIGSMLSASSELEQEIERTIKNHFEPAAVVVNEQMDVLHIRGNAGRYLELAPGKPSFNLFKMARESLSVDLRSALHKTLKTGAPVRVSDLRMKHDGGYLQVGIEVLLIKPSPTGTKRLMVVFSERGAADRRNRSPACGGSTLSRGKAQREVERLREELDLTRRSLQTIIQEHEVTIEELRAANEEVQSSNEELQSTNEELTTAKEELQSSNEELTTLNEELETRNDMLSRGSLDFRDILQSSDIAVLTIDSGMKVGAFTPRAQEILHLIPADEGRSISELRLGMQMPGLEEDVRKILDGQDSIERRVTGTDGRLYLLRIRPFCAKNEKQSGVTLLFVDITGSRILNPKEAAVTDAKEP